MSIDILFQNQNLLIINKPSGLLVHSSHSSGQEPTVVDWILETFPDIEGVGEDMHTPQPSFAKASEDSSPKQGSIIKRPGIAHRLDRDTSGVLVVAKTQESFENLKKQFQDRAVQKTYHAIVYGWSKEDFGTIDQPIGRSRKNFRQWLAGRGSRGTQREAQTEWRVLKRFEKEGEKYAYLEIHPKTGRTHQIRVHMKYLNHPIVADELYGGKRAKKLSSLGFERQALHASRIALRDVDGQEVVGEAPLPDDFTNALQ